MTRKASAIKSKILAGEISICDLHTGRIEMAFNHIKHLLPITADTINKVSDEELGFFELLTARFAKLQDTIGQKVFPLLLELLQEDIGNKSFLDRLNLLEKIGVLKNVDFWIELREARNSLAHEYPDQPDIIATNLNQVIAQAMELLKFYKSLKNFIMEHKLSQA